MQKAAAAFLWAAGTPTDSNQDNTGTVKSEAINKESPGSNSPAPSPPIPNHHQEHAPGNAQLMHWMSVMAEHMNHQTTTTTVDGVTYVWNGATTVEVEVRYLEAMMDCFSYLKSLRVSCRLLREQWRFMD